MKIFWSVLILVGVNWKIGHFSPMRYFSKNRLFEFGVLLSQRLTHGHIEVHMRLSVRRIDISLVPKLETSFTGFIYSGINKPLGAQYSHKTFFKM